MPSLMQSLWILREAETKKGRCQVFGNGPLTFPRLLDVVADAAIVARARDTGPRFPEVRGKIENRRAQPDFLQQNRRSLKVKTGVWSAVLGFSRTSGSACRKYAANSGTPEHTAFIAQRNLR